MDSLTAADRELTLLDLLDRILDKGVIIHGDITLAVADVDLIYVGLRVLLTSVDHARQHNPQLARFSPNEAAPHAA